MKELNKKLFAAATAIVLLVVCAFSVCACAEDTHRGQMSEGFGTYEKRDFDGKTYLRKNGLTTILFLGVDKDSDAELKNFQAGGQSDFILLVVIDEDTKTVRRLQINRDTMAEITTTNIMGHPNGTRVAQICLSHGFGRNEEERCRMTVNAVSNLLGGEEIDFYVAVGLDSIPAINDALGGVTVTLNEDITAYDPEMTQGKTMTLNGQQAEYMVRSRYYIADGSNAKRMERQRIYMNAAVEKLRERLNEDEGFINQLFETLGDAATMNISRGRIINEANRAYKYEIRPIEYIDGEYTVSDDGFVEFWPDQASIDNWVRDVFYRLP